MLYLAKSRKFVALVAILVMLLFLFPAKAGSFQSTHGPTSTIDESLFGLVLQVLALAVAVLAARPSAVIRILGRVTCSFACPAGAPRNGLVFLRC